MWTMFIIMRAVKMADISSTNKIYFQQVCQSQILLTVELKAIELANTAVIKLTRERRRALCFISLEYMDIP